MAEGEPRRGVIGWAVILAIILAGGLFFLISRSGEEQNSELAGPVFETSGVPQSPVETPAAGPVETAMEEATHTPEAMIQEQGMAAPVAAMTGPSEAMAVPATAETGFMEWIALLAGGAVVVGSAGMIKALLVA